MFKMNESYRCGETENNLANPFRAAIKKAQEHQQFFVDTSCLAELFCEECIIFMDIIGASYSYSTSLETPANTLARAHRAVLNVIERYGNVRMYRFSDSYFFTFSNTETIFKFITDLNHSFLLSNSTIRGWCFGHFLLPRIAIATGLVLEQARLEDKLKTFPELQDVLIGPAVVNAYRLERSCPPFGVVFDRQDKNLVECLNSMRLHADSGHGHLLRRFCQDAKFRDDFQRYENIFIYPWFLFSIEHLNGKLKPAKVPELTDKFRIFHLILHRFWYEYRMRGHRMPSEQISCYPKGNRKKGVRGHDISDSVCKNMGMYERMLLDYYSMISGHPYTMPSFKKISILKNSLDRSELD